MQREFIFFVSCVFYLAALGVVVNSTMPCAIIDYLEHFKQSLFYGYLLGSRTRFVL